MFRVYCSFNVASGLVVIAVAATSFRRGDKWAWWALLVGNTIAFGAAMTYDWTVNAIGPFELLEYLGLALIYAALVVHAPFLAGTAYATGVEAPLRDATARQHGDVHQAGGVGSGVVVPLQGSSSQHQRNVE